MYHKRVKKTGEIDRERKALINRQKEGRKIGGNMKNNMDEKAKTDKEVAATLNEEVCTRGSIRFESLLRAPHESITEQKDARRREQDKMKSGRSERRMKRHTEINEMTKRETGKSPARTGRCISLGR
jgi:hypothetical protein